MVQFTRVLVRSAITLRELESALHAHTKVWHLGERVVRPSHVRRALELCGGARLNVRMQFGKLVERFSEGEESEDEDSDVPLVVRAQTRTAKAIAFKDKDEDDDGNTNVDECEQKREQAGPGKDVQGIEAAWERWSSSYREIVYSASLQVHAMRARPSGNRASDGVLGTGMKRKWVGRMVVMVTMIYRPLVSDRVGVSGGRTRTCMVTMRERDP